MHTYYPSELTPDILYYLEFVKWSDLPESFKLLKRQFIENGIVIEEDELKKGLQEVHPWNLMAGPVDKPELISASTKEFLKFMVDSLNDRVNK